MAEKLDYHDPRNRVPVTDGELWGNRMIIVMVVVWLAFVIPVGIIWLTCSID